MKITEVSSSAHEQLFLKVPHRIYQNDPTWVSHLNKDVKAIFDSQQNTIFERGVAQRWLLLDDQGQPMGRVAAFITYTDSSKSAIKSGGMGFFECIEDEAAAHLLMDTCTQWLQERDCTYMEGPINFGEKDKFWGLMVEGYVHPSYLENYNPPYYKAFFEAYGFEKKYEQTTSELTIETFNYPRFKKISERVMNNPKYTFEHFKRAELDRFAGDFVEIYNQAWVDREDFEPMDKSRVKDLLKSLLPVMIDSFVWFAYADGKPAAIYANIIEVNEIFRHFNGRFNLLDKLRFLYYKWTTKPSRLKGIVFGIIPQYHNTGIETGMIINIYEEAKHHPALKAFELAWVGDFNPKMQSLLKALGSETIKVHATYGKAIG